MDIKHHYITYNAVSTNSTLMSIAYKLAERWKDENNKVRRTKRDFASAFNSILTGIEICQGYSDNTYLWIPINKNLYNTYEKRNFTYTTEVYNALTWLIKSGYLIQVQGIERSEDAKRFEMKYRPYAYQLTDKWKLDISESRLSTKDEIVRNPLASKVLLRDRVKAPKTSKQKYRKPAINITSAMYQENAELLDSSTKLIEAYDELMSKQDVTLLGEYVHPRRLSLTRIFSHGSFALGGRFYSPIQNIKKDEERPHIRFNGDPAIEIDFKAVHPMIMYGQLGLAPPEDPYEIDGYIRDDVKIAFNIMLNSDNAHSAAGAIVNDFEGRITTEEAHQLQEKIVEKNKPIEKFFNTGDGLKLQFIDSQIMAEVLSYFVFELKHPIIPIHDSALVSVRDTEHLVVSLKDAFAKVMDKEDRYAQIPMLKGEASEFKDHLNELILKCFQLRSEEVSKEEWDAAIEEESRLL